MSGADESRDERQLPPSERKLQKAREEGQVARSRDVGHAMVLGAALLGLVAAGPIVGDEALGILRAGLRFTREQAIEPARMLPTLGDSALAALWIVVPASLVLLAAATVATLIPSGFLLTTKPLTPNFGRLNPLSGLSRIFSRDGVVDLAKLGGTAAALGAVAAWVVAGRFESFAGLATAPLATALQELRRGFTSGVGALVGLLVVVALIDVPLQWWRHRRRLMMTREEARKEAREVEGDPMVRGRLRARQREIARGRMLAAVPAADVVVTNPTHYAVAIRYDESRMRAPRVVAKGADHLAARIREVALDAGVPLFEAPPLARALYAHVDVDREIPSELYAAVAQVLAYLHHLRHFVPGRGPRPVEPEDLQVPPGMDPLEADE